MRKNITRNEELIIRDSSDSEKHCCQAIEYKKLASLFTKNNMIGTFEMLAILGPLYYISTEAPFAKAWDFFAHCWQFFSQIPCVKCF